MVWGPRHHAPEVVDPPKSSDTRTGAASGSNRGRALFQARVTIHSAHIATYGERAIDVFYLTDLTGAKIESAVRLKALEKKLLAIAASPGTQAEAA